MASEYKLPYTAKEINEKLNKIDTQSEKLLELEEEIGNISTSTYTHPESHPASMITGLSTVATSGSYNDLSDKPALATTAETGLMSATDKTKLDGIETGANKTTVDSALSSSSTNPVQNKVVNTALANKVDKVSGKGLSTNDYTTTEKNKLAGIATGANAYSLPTASSSTLGGIKVGNNLTISNGVLSAEAGGVGASGTGTNAEIFNSVSTNKASGSYSHAEGSSTIASGIGSHAEGIGTTASGHSSHAEGNNTTASNEYSHAEGHNTRASGSHSHAEGYETTASGDYSHAEGCYATASGIFSSSHGRCTTAQGRAQAVFGKFNTLYAGATDDSDTTGSIFIVGVGTDISARANAFRITNAGQCMGSQSFATTGADYAEYYEWEDGNPNNEDRRGHFVTFAKGRKIRIANDTDNYILGIVSSTPSVIGNAYTDQWQGMYLTDVFGERLTETVEVEEEEEEVKDEEGNIIETIPAHTETRFILNPDYDHTKPYIGRNERQEWAIIGTHGQLVLIDDGVCEEGDFCTVSKDGTAIKSDSVTKYRVTERIDNTHIWIQIL